MPKTIRRSVTYANVASTMALVAALGTGGAYAASTIGSDDIIDNSVRSIDIKDDHVRRSDMGADAIGPEAVKDRILNAPDISKASGTAPWDPPNITAGTCVNDAIDTGVDIRGDAIALSPPYVDSVTVHIQGPMSIYWDPQEILVTLCNDTANDIDLGATRFSYVVFDN